MEVIRALNVFNSDCPGDACIICSIVRLCIILYALSIVPFNSSILVTISFKASTCSGVRLVVK